MAQTQTQLHFRPTHLNESLVDLVDNGIIVVDNDLIIHHYNKWIEIQTHIKESAVIGQKITDLFSTINAKILKRKIKTTLLMQNATYYTANTSGYLIPIKINQIQNSKFEYMQQDVSIVPYDLEHNQVALIITDQTRMANTQALLEENILEVKKLNNALLKEKELTQKQYEQLLESSRNAAMGEMISMIAHQWRQPLSIINTSIGTIKVKQELNILDKESMDTTLQRIETTVLHLSETINDFRDYFKPNKKQTLVNLSSLLEKAANFLQTELENFGIQYTQEIDTDIDILTYKNEFLQAILNILKNAIDAYEHKNLTNKFIQVSANIKNKKLHLNILDNAGGIQADVLTKVFEPYFSTKSKNGTGLGLYMSQKIIQEHLKGSIQISSKDNKTLVTITLPIQEK